ncbi:MAG TPA: family 20 glycosylhydrolase, partial [Planctomycetota bacterium]|nr:family 20 glycosylhydrolase [Planctomycetota bacterium]
FSLTRGTPVELLVRDQAGYTTTVQAGRVRMEIGSTADFMAACGQWLTAAGSAAATPPFTFRAVMIDCSRNGVIKIEKLKQIIPTLAMLGLNAACLYTEDTYEVQGHPRIGYQRGKYTPAEIREIDRFAASVGVELFPCIQTLGHLSHVLKFPHYRHLRDNEHVLNLLKPETYELLEAMIKSASAPYRSKRIHIGMDETHGLGLGNSWNPAKQTDPRSMYVNHVQKIAALCKRLKLSPIMWGDIVIGMSGGHAMDKKQTAKLPHSVEMNYWDYYREDPKIYHSQIKGYRAMGFEPLVSPGLWNWNRFWPSFDKMNMSSVPFMEVSKRLGIKRAMMTMWGDDGQECPFDANLPALALYLEHCMVKSVDLVRVKARLKAVTGANFDDLTRPQLMDQPPGVKKAAIVPMNFGKNLIWDDPLVSRIGSHAGKRRFGGYYAKLAKAIAASLPRTRPEQKSLLTFALRATEYLTLKADLHARARQAYGAGNRRELAAVLKDVPETLRRLAALQASHAAVWMAERKPFGWERLDLRYGGQTARLKSFAATLQNYLRGKAKTIPEFDEKPVTIYNHYPLIHLTVNYDAVATPSTHFV